MKKGHIKLILVFITLLVMGVVFACSDEGQSIAELKAEVKEEGTAESIWESTEESSSALPDGETSAEAESQEEAAKVPDTSAGSDDKDGLIDINKADTGELSTLPGIGEAKAQRIVDYRNSNGAFKSIEDIKQVNGIGEKTFEKLKSRIKV